MGYQAGYGGSVDVLGAAADVQKWELVWRSELHDTTVVSDAGVRRTKGIEDWTLTCNIHVDIGTPDDLDAASFGVGDALTTIHLKSSSSAYPRWTLAAGIIESCTYTFDPHAPYSGTIIVQSNGEATYDAAAP